MSIEVRRLLTWDDFQNDVKLHASRHDRGGVDALNWSSVSKFKKNTVTGISAVVSGGTLTYTSVLTVDENFYNLIPLSIKVTPSGLATGESLTIYVQVKDQDGNTYVIVTKSDVTATTTITISDLDFTVLPNGSQIREVLIAAESNQTSTSATIDVTIAEIET